MRRRRAAYYSRNNSYSRSYNASCAEAEGRLPRTRAAAALGLSTKAFDAGCAACGYRATEWHHVGKYANMVDYYDTEELSASAEFWTGAALSYKTKAKQNAILEANAERIAAAKEEARQERLDDFARLLAARRNCAVTIKRHSTRANWDRFVVKVANEMGIPIQHNGEEVPCGEHGWRVVARWEVMPAAELRHHLKHFPRALRAKAAQATGIMIEEDIRRKAEREAHEARRQKEMEQTTRWRELKARVVKLSGHPEYQYHKIGGVAVLFEKWGSCFHAIREDGKLGKKIERATMESLTRFLDDQELLSLATRTV